MFTRLDYSSALENSILRRYTNIVYYFMSCSVKFSEVQRLSYTGYTILQAKLQQFKSVCKLSIIGINSSIICKTNNVRRRDIFIDVRYHDYK